MIKHVREHVSKHDAFPEPYWANTSSNSIIKQMVEQSDENDRKEFETLMEWGTIEKKIHENITYGDISHKNSKEGNDNLWNFLFFTGYMRKISERMDGEDIYVTMRIPNREIRSIYGNQVSRWFERQVRAASKDALHQAVLGGDAEAMGKILTSMLKKSISTFDSSESFYHGFFISTLYGIEDYTPRSNREEGEGRPDIVLYPETPFIPAIIFEIKIRKKFNEMKDGIKEAFKQIKEKKYGEGILEDGYAGYMSYGVCFCKKYCIVEKMD